MEQINNLVSGGAVEDVLFCVFAALTLLCAVLVVANPFSRNPVTSAMFLVLTIISMSGLFLLLHAFFLAAVQILVYAGAVMVLFLFIIMLLNTDDPEGAYPWKAAALGLAVFFLLGAGVLWLFHWSGAVASTPAGATPPELSDLPKVFTTSAKSFGRLLYTKYLLPLEIAGFLLLVALVGVVSLSKDSTEENA